MFNKISRVQILDDSIATDTGDTIRPVGANLTFQMTGETSADAGAAEVVIQGTLVEGEDDVIWETIDTLSLTLGTTTTSDWGVSTNPWPVVRAKVNSISGTDGTVRVFMAVDHS